MKIGYSASNKIGSFNLMYEFLNDPHSRPLLNALFYACSPVLHVEEHESGRGKNYVCASEMFQPLLEGEEIPQYRIEIESARAFNEEERAKALVTPAGVRMYAVRNTIVRVPPLNMKLTAQQIH